MTVFRVEPEQVAALGAGLVELAEALAGQGEQVGQDAWALGDGASSRAFVEAVSHWRHERISLARALDELGHAAVDVGGLYLATEEGVGRSLVGGPT